MRILVLFAHPVETSFNAALHAKLVATLRARGHEVDDCDLNAEGFDPVLSGHQRGVYFDESQNARGLEDHVAALRRAEGLLLIYPTWWFGMPALLKGWFDRVWVPGVAFHLGGPKVLQPLLTDLRRIGVVTTYGSPRWLLWWVCWPDWLALRGGPRPLCASRCRVEWIGLAGMDVDRPERRRRFLVKVAKRLSAWR